MSADRQNVRRVVVRTIGKGSSCACLALDVHPFNEFAASGSSDSCLRLHDLRDGACLHAYKGHRSGVSHVRFAPDGRLLASASADGCVRVWDLTAGRLLHEFSAHVAAITGLEFHPCEFLLAAAAADGTVTLLDIDAAGAADMLGPDPAGVHAIAFQEGGSALLSAGPSALQAWQWEPARRVGRMDAAWGCPAAVRTCGGGLLVASLQGPRLSVWSAELDVMAAHAATPKPEVQSPEGLRVSVGPRSCMAPHTAHRRFCLPSGYSRTPSPITLARAAEKQALRGTQEAVPQQGLVHRLSASSLGDAHARCRLRPRSHSTDALCSISSRTAGRGEDAADAQEAARRSTDSDAAAVLQGHAPLQAALEARLAHLQGMRELWQRGDVRGTLSAARTCGDEAAVADMLEALATRRDAFRLEHAADAASLAAALLPSTCVRRAAAGAAMLASLMDWFRDVILGTCRASPSSAPDLSGEARRQRCKAARHAMLSALPDLARLASEPGEVGARARSVTASLQTLSEPPG